MHAFLRRSKVALLWANSLVELMEGSHWILFLDLASGSVIKNSFSRFQPSRRSQRWPGGREDRGFNPLIAGQLQRLAALW